MVAARPGCAGKMPRSGPAFAHSGCAGRATSATKSRDMEMENMEAVVKCGILCQYISGNVRRS